MGGHTRILLASAVAGAALVASSGVSSAGPAFCSVAKPPVQKNVGAGKPTKHFPYKGGDWCAYGSTGPYVQRIPGVSKAAFKASAGSGKSVRGLGVPAYFSPAGDGYSTVSALKGTTEIVVGAKSTEQRIVAATKGVLALVH